MFRNTFQHSHQRWNSHKRVVRFHTYLVVPKYILLRCSIRDRFDWYKIRTFCRTGFLSILSFISKNELDGKYGRRLQEMKWRIEPELELNGMESNCMQLNASESYKWIRTNNSVWNRYYCILVENPVLTLFKLTNRTITMHTISIGFCFQKVFPSRKIGFAKATRRISRTPQVTNIVSLIGWLQIWALDFIVYSNAKRE